ncbi:MAG TPA: DUF1330 domain-containing protein [Ktedonobacteraceae bacterium]|nr:DUF1330 domain-containing protein [Ktedonobacteraceae bacterium]
MAAYIVADIEVTDPEEYQRYARQTPGTLEPYGGKFIVRGGQPEALEGDWQPKRIVIIEFPNIEQLKAWYNSPAYSAIMGMRHNSANSNILIVQGV